MRKGKCARCGRCCKFKTLYQSAGLIEKFIIRKKVGRKKIKEMIEAEFACPFLIYENGKAICKNYSNRPDFCMKYPETKSDLIDNSCGYKFIN